MEQKEVNEEQKNEIVRETKEPTDISDKNIEKNDKKKLPERKISFGLNKSILADINIENSINSFFKFIPFNIPQKNDEKVNKYLFIKIRNSHYYYYYYYYYYY